MRVGEEIAVGLLEGNPARPRWRGPRDAPRTHLYINEGNLRLSLPRKVIFPPNTIAS
jgi:hypothetical protein